MSQSNRLSNHQLVQRITLPDPKGSILDMVLDTDTFNEIDDQFALVYALLSPDRVKVHAVYAAPFVNAKSKTPAIGMAMSYDEIFELYQRMPSKPDVPVHRGSEQWMRQARGPVESDACHDLIERAMSRSVDDPPLYVVAIGAPTNVSSAIAKCPEIMDRIVVVWLGGHAVSHPTAREFNLGQDLLASQTLFDSGVPLIRIPCIPTAQMLRTTVAELTHYIGNKNPMCDFLLQRYAEHEAMETTQKRERWNVAHIAYCKEIWDVATIAILVNSTWCRSTITPSPILTRDMTWSVDPSRHLIRDLISMNRDAIFGDMFYKLANMSS
ncbi:MAG: nucleoside hydrolase [Phycisphaeraceae bacterium]|nr:nucleoside hydrolase [Phycisphaeraceae bacterium]